MAARPNKWSWRIIFVCVYLFTALIPPAAPKCLDGTYKHDGRDCCLCAVGNHVEEHCTASQTYGKCEPCAAEMFNSYPTSQTFCDSCTSCSHPNENLEEDQPCTSAKDRKCKCKDDHYCVSGTEVCKLCHLCKKCPDGIKIACTGSNNTVCNDKPEGTTGHIVGGVIGVIILVLVAGAAVFFWKKWKKGAERPNPAVNGNAPDLEPQEMQPLNDIQTHLAEVAEEIGWKDMQDIALRSRVPPATIDAFKLNHPGDSQEQTFQLLKVWVESQGNEAGKILVQALRRSSKKLKAERVLGILTNGN